MSNNYNIEPIFPIGIYTTNLPSSFLDITKLLDNEKIIINKDKNHYNQYGGISEDSYILNNKKYSKIKNYILSHCKEYGKVVLGLDSEEYIMTQSWITVKPPKTYHTPHSHSNSIISGVLYYNIYNEDTPGITFVKDDPSMNFLLQVSQLRKNKKNQFNSDEIDIKVKSNSLILFPSWLTHGVKINNSNNTRKSIAFNVLPKTLGTTISLNELKLENYE